MHNYMRAGGLFPHSDVDGAAELTVLEYRLWLCEFFYPRWHHALLMHVFLDFASTFTVRVDNSRAEREVVVYLFFVCTCWGRQPVLIP